MAEINLLQNKVKDRTLAFRRGNSVIITLFVLIFIAEIVAAMVLYLLTNSVSKQTSDKQNENQQIQAVLNGGQKDLVAAKNVQAQLKNMQTLLSNHIYWSGFFNQLGNVTPLKAEYTSFGGASSDGRIHLEGIAPSYTDVGKVLLSLSTSGKFSNVKLLSVNPSGGLTFGYNFSLEATAINSLFKKTQ
jgi:Tfp pilus assembly protein PilN